MPVAEKEFILNYAMNRWQLNHKRNVGPTSDSIRKCSPESIEEWSEYYYSNIKSYEHIESLGERLYEMIAEVLPFETRFHPDLIKSINKEDCKSYMHNLVINRTYNGYKRERGNSI